MARTIRHPQGGYGTSRPSGSGKHQPADVLRRKRRAGIKRTRKVAGVSEVGRMVGRGVRARKSRMPRR